jgi:C1A family cysteine protease
MEDFEFGFGCNPPKVDLRDYTINRNVLASAQLPEEYSIEMLADIKNQGSVGSCVAHATSSILEHHAKNQFKLSTDFIYGIHNKLYGTEGPGMYLRNGAKVAQKCGDMLKDDCPTNTEVPNVYSIANDCYNDDAKMTRAYKFRIDSYCKLNNNTEIKYAIMNHGPVLISIKWYNGSKVKDGVLTSNFDNDYGYHAIVVYGWNEKGFLCQNSWGKNWGDKGYFILPYNHSVREAYSFIDVDNDEELKNLDKPNPGGNAILNAILKFFSWIINLFKPKN